MDQKEKEFLTRAEAADLLGLQVQTLGNWAWKGEGPAMVKLNKRLVRYHRESLLEWARSHTVQPGQRAS